jgi:hypothetical protein
MKTTTNPLLGEQITFAIAESGGMCRNLAKGLSQLKIEWPTEDELDLELTRKALEESNERIPYDVVRQELGLET